jgi:hypothetical protein
VKANSNDALEWFPWVTVEANPKLATPQAPQKVETKTDGATQQLLLPRASRALPMRLRPAWLHAQRLRVLCAHTFAPAGLPA